MLDAAERSAVEAESHKLRLALKTWETDWAHDHGGVKPARDDISRNPEIAKKYKAYNQARALLSGKTLVTSDVKRDGSRRKRKQEPAPSITAAATDTQPIQTPSKRVRATKLATPSRAAKSATPSQPNGGYCDVYLERTPSISRKLFSPVVPTSIGPTPQRDGRVLGLFDILDEEEKKTKKRSAVAATPSKRTLVNADAALEHGRQGLGQASAAVLEGTPRKQTVDVDAYRSDEEDSEIPINVRRLGRTPMSSGRRNLLNQFTAGGSGAAPFAIDRNSRSTTQNSNGALGTTPLKPRNNVNQTAPRQQLLATPSKGSNNDLQQYFATPAFLRRQPSALAPVDENGEFMSPPGKLRLPRKPLMRGLSSVLASLRKAEDDALDEQLDVLRDLERSEDVKSSSKPRSQPSMQRHLEKLTQPTQTSESAKLAADIEVEDSQAQGQARQDQEWEQQDLEHRELELYEQEKAKLERQNQILDPDHVAGGLLGGFDDEGLYDSPPEDQLGRDGQPLRVYKKKGQKRTTRLSHMRPTRTKRPPVGSMADLESDNENEDGDRVRGERDPDASDFEVSSGVRIGVDGERNGSNNSKISKVGGKGAEKAAVGPISKAVRKVNELAHANFKRLKLRNSGSKGGPGFNSRFRRRR
ncbi:MAG: hypothetical protein SEPTF4163_000963 [Sporothrix epigloea]